MISESAGNPSVMTHQRNGPLDTALALTLRNASGVVTERAKALSASFARLASMKGDVPLMGRTRMQVALPMTVADRVRSWRQPLQDHISSLEALRPRVERLQLGGAVGTRQAFGDDSERIAAHMADALGLAAGPVWHTDRTAIVEYAGRLSLLTGALGKFGQDVALMSNRELTRLL